MAPVLQAAALCVTAALLSLTLRRHAGETALLLCLAAVVLVLLRLGDGLGEILILMEEMEAYLNLQSGLFRPIYKLLGIALVVRLGGDLCRDAGESALASALELAGTVCALSAVLPLLRTALNLMLELMT